MGVMFSLFVSRSPQEFGSPAHCGCAGDGNRFPHRRVECRGDDNWLRLNCGLCRERGTVRTSTSRFTSCAFRSWMNSFIGRVECPMVMTIGFVGDAPLFMPDIYPES